MHIDLHIDLVNCRVPETDGVETTYYTLLVLLSACVFGTVVFGTVWQAGGTEQEAGPMANLL